MADPQCMAWFFLTHPLIFSCTEMMAHPAKALEIYMYSNIPRQWVQDLRGSLPKSGPLDFATKNTFPLFFVGEEALVGIY